MFSVVIPCRGHGEWLSRAIESVATGEPPSNGIEIIVVFDADQKAYKQNEHIIHKYENVKAYATEGQSGAYRTKNTGIVHASGDLIGFCDADDTVSPLWAREMYDRFKMGFDVVNCWHHKMDAFDNLIKPRAEALGGVYAYRATLIKSLGGFEPWVCSADSDLFYRAKKLNAKVSTVKKHLYNYRQHGDQLTKKKATQFGSIRRKMYEAKWHDGRLNIEMIVPNHRRLK